MDVSSSERSRSRRPAGLTLRALATGFIIGGLLAPSNIYTGLKIGFSFNMSIAAALLGYALWNGLNRIGKARPWGILENNVNQTAASASASILSAGLVAPIPALTLITGQSLAYPVVAVWVFIVSFLGIVTAVAIRRQMIEREGLPFPNGLATGETLKEIHAHGREAARRLRWLIGAGIAAAATKLTDAFVTKLPSLGLPSAWGFSLPGRGVDSVSWRSLGIEIQPSLLLFGFGAIVGPRVGASLLLGTLLAWMALPPWLLDRGFTTPASGGTSWYEAMLEWLLWPGVSLMAAAALTSAALAIAAVFRRAGGRCRGKGSQRSIEYSATFADDDAPGEEGRVGALRSFPVRWFWGAAAFALAASVLAQALIFGIPLWLGAAAFGLSFLLAIVAARVSGETGIPPIGALGKITQVTFGFLAPGSTTVNLMAANVTGGAAGQCSDMLHDLKTGRMIGADLRAQVIAQLCGIFSGSLAGTAAYLLLIPDPQAMLLTPEWPAPAVATWKAVAEVVAQGLGTIPPASRTAVLWATLAGIFLAVLEASLRDRHRRWVPSASSIGFAFIIPPFISLAIFLGSVVRVILHYAAPRWKKHYLIVAAAGLVAGESLAGIFHALVQFVRGVVGG